MVTILLNYCGPKLSESEDKEMKAVIRDLVIILGYFCANNRRNQVNIHIDSIIENTLSLTSIKIIEDVNYC